MRTKKTETEVKTIRCLVDEGGVEQFGFTHGILRLKLQSGVNMDNYPNTQDIKGGDVVYVTFLSNKDKTVKKKAPKGYSHSFKLGGRKF